MQYNHTQIILDAQKQLVNHPYDLAHDVTHHYRVVEWCRKIVTIEKLVINWNVLEAAAWWHDVQDRRGIKLNKLISSLRTNGSNKTLEKRVVNLIKEHSFGTKQSSTEAKVLFDADKLEYVNPPRLEFFLHAVQDEIIPLKKYLTYKKDWNIRTPLIPSLLYYKYSKKQFRYLYKEVEQTIKFIDKNFIIK